MPQKNRTVRGVLGGLVGLVGLSAVAGLLVTASVTPVLAMTGLAGTQALTLFDQLPESLDPSTPMEQSTIYATAPDGSTVELASFYEQNRVPVTYEQVSPNLYDAILSSEDKNFYSHGGVNIGATVKALVDNVRGTSSRGRFDDQPAVREERAHPEVRAGGRHDLRHLLRRSPAVLARRDQRDREQGHRAQAAGDAVRDPDREGLLEENDILLGYLNIANFGGTVYGIEAAANYYFSTTAANLTVAQSATLAGIVQNPTPTASTRRNRARSRRRGRRAEQRR